MEILYGQVNFGLAYMEKSYSPPGSGGRLYPNETSVFIAKFPSHSGGSQASAVLGN